MSAVFVRTGFEFGLRAGDTAAEIQLAAIIINCMEQGYADKNALYEAVVERLKSGHS